MPAANLNQLWARSLVDALHRAGVRQVVIAPGSRSAPLALAFAEHAGIRAWSVIDERSAAFFALGLGKDSRVPAVVVCTSGTAGTNCYPAVVEGAMARVPMLIMTADRPPELHGWGALQTIAQQSLYGGFARWFVDVGVPEATASAFAHLRATACRAVAVTTQAPKGPVQINVPFREPLEPTPVSFDPEGVLETQLKTAFTVELTSPERRPKREALDRIIEQIHRCARGVIVCGPLERSPSFAEAVGAMSRATGYPVLAECDSGVRFSPLGGETISLYEALLSHEGFAADHRPEVILRFGGGLISKRLQAWLDGSRGFTAVFTDEAMWVDPMHTASVIVDGGVTVACELLGAAPVRAQSDWFLSFARAERTARAALEGAFAQEDALSEPRIAHEAVGSMPAGASLIVSSSMPIRDVDAFAPASKVPVRVFANRGANGIDGMVSTALGVAAASKRPSLLLCGDLALVHDLGGLLTAKRHPIALTVLVVHNDGGGIFSFLPISRFPSHFEQLFGTPHGLDFSAAAQLFGARFVQVGSASKLKSTLKECLEGGFHLVEVRTSRQTNPIERQRLINHIGGALNSGAKS